MAHFARRTPRAWRMFSFTVTIATLASFLASGCNGALGSGYRLERPAPVEPLKDSMFDDGLSDAERIHLIRATIGHTVSVDIQKRTKTGIEESGGTGVVIDAKGTVLTAYHVVDDAIVIEATHRILGDDDRTVLLGRSVRMTVLAKDEERDVALLRPTDPSEPMPEPIQIAKDWFPVSGEQLWQFGRTSKWVRGKVADPLGERTPKNGDAQLGFIVRPGDSGGPVVRTDGMLVGIVLSCIAGDPATEDDDVGFFMPVHLGLKALGYFPGTP